METKSVLAIRDLQVQIGEKPIVKGLSLTVRGGEVHALMGPNGTGKSTLSAALMGHPRYTIAGGEVTIDGQDVLAMKTDERARAGLFLAMQYPSEISGVSNSNFLRTAHTAVVGEEKKLSVLKFRDELRRQMEFLEMQPGFAERYVNEGFSGGEKKRNEILQMLILRPGIAILDEIDSGLDIDALKVVSKGVNRLVADGMGALIITHYQRILDYVKPDFVHVMMDGRIVRSGGPELAGQLEEKGYDWVREEIAG